MKRSEGKAVAIMGAGRGMDCALGVRLGNEGADIIATDLCASVDTVRYARAVHDKLAETVQLGEERDQRPSLVSETPDTLGLLHMNMLPWALTRIQQVPSAMEAAR